MNDMNTKTTQPGQPHVRKIKYIDHVLQKWLLVALVVLEIVVLSAAGAFLYVRLNAIVDASLYRIHFAGQPSMFSLLLSESLQIVGALILVNMLALLVADRIWARYVSGILDTLRGLISRTQGFDLGTDAGVPERHKIISLALQWRSAERDRHLHLRQSLDHMGAQKTASVETYRAGLLAFRGQLPKVDA
jgi:hypothetical protein